MKFRKIEEIVEAVQLTPELALECFMANGKIFGRGITGSWHPERKVVNNAQYRVTSADGQHIAKLNDWIWKSIDCEVTYCCCADEFASLFEPIPEPPPRYFFDQDSDSHWYMVPESIRDVWKAWQALDSNLEAAWTEPDGAIALDGFPGDISFEKPSNLKV